MKGMHTCSRCGRIRYEDRMRPVHSEAHPGQTFYICASRLTCNIHRKMVRKSTIMTNEEINE